MSTPGPSADPQQTAGDEERPFGRKAVAAALVLYVGELVLLAAWQRNGYWEFSDGVYADSARELLQGHYLYSDVAAPGPGRVALCPAVRLNTAFKLSEESGRRMKWGGRDEGAERRCVGGARAAAVICVGLLWLLISGQAAFGRPRPQVSMQAPGLAFAKSVITISGQGKSSARGSRLVLLERQGRRWRDIGSGRLPGHRGTFALPGYPRVKEPRQDSPPRSRSGRVIRRNLPLAATERLKTPCAEVGLWDDVAAIRPAAVIRPGAAGRLPSTIASACPLLDRSSWLVAVRFPGGTAAAAQPAYRTLGEVAGRLPVSPATRHGGL